VTTIQDHIEYVEENPFDQTAALSLADRIQDEWSFGRYAALRRVAKMRRPGRQAHYIAAAAAVMARGSRSAMMARDHAIAACMWNVVPRTTLVLVSGFRSPEAGVNYTIPAGQFPFGITVSVGAREFIRLQKSYLREVRSMAQRSSVRQLKKKAGLQ